MRKNILFLLLIIGWHSLDAQILSRFQPLSYEEILLSAQAQAIDNAYRQRKFEEYQDEAYRALNRGDRSGFLTYSSYALNTGWYNAKLYYDRGQAFQYFGDYKNAKKEYKKAKKKGYYLANIALEELKKLKKRKK